METALGESYSLVPIWKRFGRRVLGADDRSKYTEADLACMRFVVETDTARAQADERFMDSIMARAMPLDSEMAKFIVRRRRSPQRRPSYHRVDFEQSRLPCGCDGQAYAHWNGLAWTNHRCLACAIQTRDYGPSPLAGILRELLADIGMREALYALCGAVPPELLPRTRHKSYAQVPAGR